jgi:hypothetical protein
VKVKEGEAEGKRKENEWYEKGKKEDRRKYGSIKRE